MMMIMMMNTSGRNSDSSGILDQLL